MEHFAHNALELLAPAGAWESMVAAVQNGADAVYFGGSAFHARRYAQGFDDAQVQHAIAYCHARGVRAYITCNTLLLDKELPRAFKYAAFLYRAGADALIVQDLGLARMLRAQVTALPLHASTQLCIHDEAGLYMCKELGLTRVVLGRELSLNRIRSLHSAVDIELECFAHGALCTAVSGVCLFSSLAGGRSGNRGACAQPCRKAYGLGVFDKHLYPLSLQDLCMYPHIQQLQDVGVTCIKLEGRMKRPEYVAAMTALYRMAIDGAPQEDIARTYQQMEQIFTRGRSTGYYFCSDVPAGAKGVLGTGQAALKRWRESYQKERKKQPVKAVLRLKVGESAQLRLSLGKISVQVQGDCVQPAQKAPDTSRYQAQIAKMQDTPFFLEAMQLDMQTPGFLPVSALNALRRSALEALYGMLQRPRDLDEPSPPAMLAPSREGGKTQIVCVVEDCKRALAAIQAGASHIALAPVEYAKAACTLEALQKYRKTCKLLLQLPAVDIGGDMRDDWEMCFSRGLLDGGIAQNAGQIASIKGECFAGYLCNASNGQAVSKLRELGYTQVVASLEVNQAQLRDMIAEHRVGVYVYGRVQLMQLWHCPYKAASGCNACKNEQALQDAAGRIFPLDTLHTRSGCLHRVRNCNTLDILDVLHTLPMPPFMMLEFTNESEDVIQARVLAAKEAAAGNVPLRYGETRGHWSRGWEA